MNLFYKFANSPSSSEAYNALDISFADDYKAIADFSIWMIDS